VLLRFAVCSTEIRDHRRWSLASLDRWRENSGFADHGGSKRELMI